MVLKCCRCECCSDTVVNFIRPNFNVLLVAKPLKIAIEALIEFSIAGVIIFLTWDFGTNGEVLGAIVTFFVLIIIIMIPILTIYVAVIAKDIPPEELEDVNCEFR